MIINTKYLLVCLLTCLLITPIFGQPITKSKVYNKIQNKDTVSNKAIIESDINRQIHLQSDTINLRTKVEFADNKRNIIDYIFPSIIAIVVAFIAFWSSKSNMNKQLASSKRTLDQQIKASKESLDKQIENAKYTAELIFRQNVLSSNRVNWIENLRTKASLLSSKMLMLSTIDDPLMHPKEIEQLMEHCSYIELMLNPNDPRDNNLINLTKALPILVKQSFDKTKDIKIGKLRQDFLELVGEVLKTEWERVKKGE
jgi:hypothetical protein